MAILQRVVFLLAVCFSLHISQAKYKKQPNVIFILTDDQGYRDVGYHGSVFPTPEIDKLAAEGVKLENYYVQPICTPTRTQLMTGRYQIRTGMQHRTIHPQAPSCLPTDEVTIAEKMREAGYSTHIVGKWHLGLYEEACLPNNRGFDSFFGILLGSGYHFTHEALPPVQHLDFHRNFEPATQYNGSYSTILYNDEVIDIINKKDNDKPFFIYLSHQTPHAPLEVPEQYIEPLRDMDIFEDENRLTYAAMIGCLDEGIGKIIDALKTKGIYEETVIIFSSDNGAVHQYGSNWPLRGRKASVYEGGIRTIGFVHSPLLSNKVKGTVNNELIHVSDWLPTIVEGIAGWNTDGTKPLDGINQWKTISYGTCSPRIEVLHHMDPLSIIRGGRDWVRDISPFNISIHASVRYRDWKLITGDQGSLGWYAPPETEFVSINAPAATEQIVWLYNIKHDPLEMYDLSDKRRGIVKFLLNKLQNYLLDSVPVLYPPIQPDASNPCLNGNNCVWGPWAPAAVTTEPA